MKAIINDNGTILTLLRKELFTSAPFKLPSKLWVESKALLIFFLKKNSIVIKGEQRGLMTYKHHHQEGITESY